MHTQIKSLGSGNLRKIIPNKVAPQSNLKLVR